MLSTHYRKDAQLIAATIDNDTEKVKKRIYFLAPDESTSSSDSGSSDDDDSDDEYFRPPMAKRRRRSKHAVDDDTVYKCKLNEYIVPYYNPKRESHHVYCRGTELWEKLLCGTVPKNIQTYAPQEAYLFVHRANRERQAL